MMVSRTVVTACVVVLGIGLLMNPYYLWPHHGVDAYELGVGQPLSETDSPTPIEDLPPETAAAVDEAVEAYEGDGERPMFEGQDAVPTDGLSWDDGRPTVAVDGTTYVVIVDGVDRSPPLLPAHPFVRVSMGFAGATALGLAAVAAVAGTARLTTRRAWTLVLTWGLVLCATILYDGGVEGIGLGDSGASMPFEPILGPSVVAAVGVFVLLLPAVGVVYGTALCERGWRDPQGRPRPAIVAAGLVGWPFMLPGMLLGIALADPERDSPRSLPS